MEIFVPGRVCLLGEHTDWAVLHRACHQWPAETMRDGHCLAYGTNCGLRARIGWNEIAATTPSQTGKNENGDEPQLRLHFRSVVLHPPQSLHFSTPPNDTPCAGTAKYSMSYETQPDHSIVSVLDIPLLEADGSVSGVLEGLARGGTFFSYVAGTALEVLLKYSTEIARAVRNREAEGKCSTFHINNYSTDLPVGKGLSSSAAVCVLVARSLTQGILGVSLPPSEEMELAYLGERRTPSQCGRMDQCVAHGSAPVSLIFGDNGTVHCEKIVLPKGAVFHFVVADMNRSKDTQRILADLNECFKGPNNNSGGSSSKDPAIAAAAREFLGATSSTFVAAAMEALRLGSPEELGAVFTRCQVAFRAALGPACPTELTSPRLYELLGSEKIKPLVFGGKGVGSQGDGTIQFVCKSAEDQATLVEHLQWDEGCHAFAFELKGESGV